MMRRIKCAWFGVGLAILGAMIAGGREVQAASVGVSGTIVPLPGGSPFLYEFDLVLTSGSIAPGSSFTVGESPNGLVGVSTLSGTQQPPTTGNYGMWDVPQGGIVTTGTGNPPPYDFQSSVTWDYVSGPTITTVGTIVGFFTVETSQSYPDNAPPAQNGITVIDYGYSVVPAAGEPPTAGGGSFILSAPLVPEPSSIILLLIGGAALPMLYRRRVRS